jgi:hypothetical protein
VDFWFFNTIFMKNLFIEYIAICKHVYYFLGKESCNWNKIQVLFFLQDVSPKRHTAEWWHLLNVFPMWISWCICFTALTTFCSFLSKYSLDFIFWTRQIYAVSWMSCKSYSECSKGSIPSPSAWRHICYDR